MTIKYTIEEHPFGCVVSHDVYLLCRNTPELGIRGASGPYIWEHWESGRTDVPDRLVFSNVESACIALATTICERKNMKKKGKKG